VDHPLQGCNAKLRRATDHLNTLNLEVTGFLDEKPYGFVGNFEAQRRQHVFRVRLARGAGERIAHIGTVFGDMVHNLRSALDHLVYELVRLNGQKPRGTVGFPIYDTEPKDGFACATVDALRGVGTHELALIEQLQPYNRLHYERLALSFVRRFDNQDKHRTLVGLAAAVMSVSEMPVGFVAERDIRLGGEYTVSAGRLLKDGAEIFHMPAIATGPHPKVRMNGEPPLDIAFPLGPKLIRYDAIPPTAGEVFRVVRTLRPFFERLFEPPE
jgi:hypothetical protein